MPSVRFDSVIFEANTKFLSLAAFGRQLIKPRKTARSRSFRPNVFRHFTRSIKTAQRSSISRAGACRAANTGFVPQMGWVICMIIHHGNPCPAKNRPISSNIQKFDMIFQPTESVGIDMSGQGDTSEVRVQMRAFRDLSRGAFCFYGVRSCLLSGFRLLCWSAQYRPNR